MCSCLSSKEESFLCYVSVEILCPYPHYYDRFSLPVEQETPDETTGRRYLLHRNAKL